MLVALYIFFIYNADSPSISVIYAQRILHLLPNAYKYQNLIAQQLQWTPATIAKQAAADTAAIITYYFMQLQVITPYHLLYARFLLIMSR